MNRLTVISEPFLKKYKKYNVYFVTCKCSCGNIKDIALTLIKNNKTKSCGCLHKEKLLQRNNLGKHNLSYHPIYALWNRIKERCYNSKKDGYDRYGGRGITVCDEWKDNFLVFYNWCISNNWKEGLQIDRKNNDGNYEPENCRFVTAKESMNNTSYNHKITLFNETKNLKQWSEDPRCKVCYKTLLDRICTLKWEKEKAILTPPNIKYRKKK